MPRIVTGQISYASAIRDTTDETYTHGNRAYFGSEGGASGIDNIYVLYFTPVSGELQDIAESAINELRIRLTLKKKTTVATDSVFIYKVYSDAQSWHSPKSLYDIVDGGGEVYTYAWVEFANQLEAQEIIISLSGQAAYYAAQYGFSIASLTLGDITEITAYTMEADVSDRYVAPIVSLANGFGSVVDGKYWHNPANPFTLIVDYAQEAGEPIGQISLEFTGKGGITRIIHGEIGLNSIDVPELYWSYLPNSGTIKLVVSSAAGVSAEPIEMPFVVAMYDIRFTSHTSGTIVKNNSDLTLTWEPVRPDEIPSIGVVTITKYIRYIWWDDEEPATGTHQNDTTYTVSAEQLEGHSALHIAICEVYGDEVSRRDLDHAAVLNLYIQQVAGTGAVAVTGNQLIRVNWESTAQAAFQVRVGEFVSPVVWGTVTEYKVPFVLEMHKMYPVQVRIQDTSGNWTDWTEPILHTDGTMYSETTYGLSAENTGNAVQVKLKISEDFVSSDIRGEVLLFRDDVLIAQMEAADEIGYTDKYASGFVSYRAALSKAGEDSGVFWHWAPVTVDSAPKTDGLFLADGTWVPLRYTASAPRVYRTSASEETYAKYYAGRSYPVYMRSGRKTRELYMSYADPDNDLAELLEEAAGQTVCWKNRLGKVIHGEINGVSSETGRLGCKVSFGIAQADHTDGIPYTWAEA